MQEKIGKLQEELGRVTHASQLGRVVGGVLEVLKDVEEALRSVREGTTPEDEEAQVYAEAIHKALAVATTVDEVLSLIDEVSGTEADDDEFRTAAEQKVAKLQAAAAPADYAKLNKGELVAEATRRGLDTSGTAEQLRVRLIEDDATKK